MSKKFKKYLEIQKKHNAYKFAFATIEFDAETIAPKNGFEIRGEMLGLLGAEDFKIITNKKYLKLLNNLNECKKLKADQKRMIELSIKDAEELEKLPKELYKKSINLTNNAYMIWQNAKNKSDFELYMPTLNEVINLQKEKLAYFTKKDNYDYLLDTFEPGFSKKDYDNFFDNFKTEILPSLSKIEGNKLPEFLLAKYDIAKQKEFNDILMEYLGVDKNTFYCGETEHPFSSQLSMKDVRFCTKYQEKNFIDSIFSTIHELGHSFFQAYINEKYAFTPIETNISMGLHESQSRLLENYIGRSKSFWVPLFPKLKKLFPIQLKNVDLDFFIESINIPLFSFIRTEADELTYTLHVIVRYEIEKEIFKNKKFDIKSIKQLWNDKYQEYLHLLPNADNIGILQDVHWSGMSFGYFPTYSLGSAIAAQFYNQMKKDINVDQLLSEGDFLSVKKWLIDNIYQHGAMYKSKDLIKKVCNEEFDANYYIQYLKNKFLK